MAERVRIHYHRPPDRQDVYEQALLHREEGVLVTFVEHTHLERPVAVDGVSVLEPGSPAIWFTFPGAWHDIGIFHTATGRPTGIYGNILTPVRFLDDVTWETTDLFVDVWVGVDSSPRLLDEDELEAARAAGWVGAAEAAAAMAEAERLLRLAATGAWPPPIVRQWTLERAGRVLRGTRPEDTV